MKNTIILITLLCATLLHSQNFSEQWTGYFSYNNIRDISTGNGLVYAAGENSTFIYSTLDGSIKTRSTINGLSGEEISAIYYSADFDTVLIGYESGLIDVVVGDNQNVLTVVDIVNKPSIPPTEKRINHFLEFNGFVYISTGFGISLFDLGRLEFDDSYFIGDNGSSLNIGSTAVLGDYIYAAAGTSGLRRALVGNTNIIDFNNWSTVLSDNVLEVVTFNDALYTASIFSRIRKSTDGINFPVLFQFSTPLSDFHASNNNLLLAQPNRILAFDRNDDIVFDRPTFGDFSDTYSAISTIGNDVLIGTIGSGVLQVPITSPNNITQRLPNGPLENTPFNIQAIENELWVVYGEYNVSYNPGIPTEKGISHFVAEEGWTNIPFEDVLGATDLTNITVNPENTTQVFISSFNSGLLEINENIPTDLYGEANGLQSINGSSIRINGGAYDRSGNLWITNTLVREGLVRRTPAGQFQGVSVEEVLPDFDDENGMSDLVIANDGIIYVGLSQSGVMGFNPSSNTFARISGGEGAANLPGNDVRALAIDRGGTLWIGTTDGLRLLFSPSSMFENPNVSTNAIIILEDDIPQEVLNDQVITDIVVDGSNNKWVGTASAGVFYFSPNGQETIFQFNKDNSPLPTNNIQGISIDPQSGTVYFATTRGIVSFDGTSTPPAEDLENVIVYPNPVRPNFQGEVTIDGLTERSNVKITDLVGNLVYEENATAGNITWDTTAFGRHKVASGVYLILITGQDALETQIKKLMIIR